MSSVIDAAGHFNKKRQRDERARIWDHSPIPFSKGELQKLAQLGQKGKDLQVGMWNDASMHGDGRFVMASYNLLLKRYDLTLEKLGPFEYNLIYSNGEAEGYSDFREILQAVRKIYDEVKGKQTLYKAALHSSSHG